MSITLNYLQTWMEALQKASRELCQKTLGFESWERLAPGFGFPNTEIKGAFVPLVNSEGTLKIGFVSTLPGCAHLARSLMGMTPEDSMSEEDIDDSIREIANILAGRSKALMAGNINSTNLGLPILLTGFHAFDCDPDTSSQAVLLGGIECILIVQQNPL